MPQYNQPTLETSIASADIVLFWKTGSAANRTITFANLAASINSLLPDSDTVSIIASNTTLDSSYQFVVANSGGAFTITLPDASDNPGLKFRIANKGAGTVTVQKTGADVVAAGGSSGASTTIAQYNAYDFQSDGVNTWFRI